MEGNDCYKFSTVVNYIAAIGSLPVKVAIDVGANVGMVSMLMRRYFPSAQIFSFEAVREYYLEAVRRCACDANIKVFNTAICASHLYKDDLGKTRRPNSVQLRILKALPAGGPGWRGGSTIVPEDAVVTPLATSYKPLTEDVAVMTLDELVSTVLLITGASEIDYIKMDCEGCEHSSLGCASIDTLKRIRFIGGEYHNIERFFNVMRGKLFRNRSHHRRHGLAGGVVADGLYEVIEQRAVLLAASLADAEEAFEPA